MLFGLFLHFHFLSNLSIWPNFKFIHVKLLIMFLCFNILIRTLGFVMYLFPSFYWLFAFSPLYVYLFCLVVSLISQRINICFHWSPILYIFYLILILICIIFFMSILIYFAAFYTTSWFRFSTILCLLC